MKVYERLAQSFIARTNCEQSNNRVGFENHTETIERVCKDYLPHGSGFDSGSRFDFDKSRPDRLVIRADFHHMDENGFYCGWSEHEIIVTPSLAFRFDVKVTGRDKRGIKEYISDTFHYALNDDVRDE